LFFAREVVPGGRDPREAETSPPFEEGRFGSRGSPRGSSAGGWGRRNPPLNVLEKTSRGPQVPKRYEPLVASGLDPPDRCDAGWAPSRAWRAGGPRSFLFGFSPPASSKLAAPGSIDPVCGNSSPGHRAPARAPPKETCGRADPKPAFQQKRGMGPRQPPADEPRQKGAVPPVTVRHLPCCLCRPRRPVKTRRRRPTRLDG